MSLVHGDSKRYQMRSEAFPLLHLSLVKGFKQGIPSDDAGIIPSCSIFELG